MKRFILFSGDDYYPNGGMKDMTGSYDTLDQAIAAFNEVDENGWRVAGQDWMHVLDITDGLIYGKDGKLYNF